jgi:hypothetical protein
MTTPRPAGIALSEQDKASLEAAKQLPWTPPLLPLTIRRPLITTDQQQPVATSTPAVGDPYLSTAEDPVTPRNQGIIMPTFGAPRCPPLLEMPHINKEQ